MNGRCPDPSRLSDYLRGELSEVELEVIASHVDTCAECGSTLERLEHATDPLAENLRRPLPAPEFGDEPQLDVVLDRLHALHPERATAAWDTHGLAPGTQLGVYRVERLLGRGGMGAVYRAWHTQLDRPVALKILLPERVDRPDAVARFHREIRAIGRLNHPHLVTAHDAGQHDGVQYLAMELVAGLDLGRVAERTGPLPVAEACAVVCQAAEGLDYAFRQGVVHRDVKPSNLMLTPEGLVKVLDLGLARLLEPTPQDEITQTGHIVGTLDYMAPEQLGDCREADVRSDVYALGATLYRLLVGRGPFAGERPRMATEKILAILQDPVPPIDDRRPDVPAPLARLLESLLAKQPADRPATPGEMAARLTRFAAGADLKKLYEQARARPAKPDDLLTAPQPAALPPKRRLGRKWLLLTVAASAVAMVVLAGLVERRRETTPRATPALPLAAASLPVEPAPANPPIALAQRNPTPERPTATPAAPRRPTQKPAQVYPIAVLPFQDRSTDLKAGAQLADVVTARLGAEPSLCLVERADLDRVLGEQRLTLSGAVAPTDAVRIGRLTGAKLLVTGSVAQIDKTLFLVAKTIGSESGRVLVASVEGSASDDLAALAGKLATRVVEVIQQGADDLVPKTVPRPDRLASLSKALGKAKRPAVWIHVVERHVGQRVIDPAAQTELTLFCRQAGFEVIDSAEGNRKRADVILEGEGFSELAGRQGDLVSVKARVEIKAVERTSGRVIAADRQTEVVVDLAEQIAGKSALQEAAAAIAERLLPKLVNQER